jgi:hypothetical protein
LQNINEQVESLRDFKGFPSDVKIRGWLYDFYTGWVFDTEELRKYGSIEDFMRNYRDLIGKKDLKLVDSLISLEKDSIDQRSLNREHEEELSLRSLDPNNRNRFLNEGAADFISSANEFNKNNLGIELLLKGSQIKIPKIVVPKIRVNIPEIYKRKKKMSKI